MTPLLTALSSRREAVRRADVVASVSPASAASRKRRTGVLSSLLTALLRRRRRSLVPMRLIWLLMLAKRGLPQSVPVPESTDKASRRQGFGARRRKPGHVQAGGVGARAGRAGCR